MRTIIKENTSQTVTTRWQSLDQVQIEQMKETLNSDGED